MDCFIEVSGEAPPAPHVETLTLQELEQVATVDAALRRCGLAMQVVPVEQVKLPPPIWSMTLNGETLKVLSPPLLSVADFDHKALASLPQAPLAIMTESPPCEMFATGTRFPPESLAPFANVWHSPADAIAGNKPDLVIQALPPVSGLDLTFMEAVERTQRDVRMALAGAIRPQLAADIGADQSDPGDECDCAAHRDATPAAPRDVKLPRFKIGTKFKTRGKHKRECEVTDILYTFNSTGDLVMVRYVATHDFCGRSMTDYDVVETTIAMGEPHHPDGL